MTLAATPPEEPLWDTEVPTALGPLSWHLGHKEKQQEAEGDVRRDKA